MDMFHHNDDDLLQLGNSDMDDIWSSAGLMDTSLPYSDLCPSTSMSLSSANSSDGCSESGSGDDSLWALAAERGDEEALGSVILCDRMITEASLPIKSEHSYCNVLEENDHTPPISLDEDDVDREWYPVVSMQAASSCSDQTTTTSWSSLPPPHTTGSPRGGGGSVGGVKIATKTQPIINVAPNASIQSSVVLPSGRRLVVTSQKEATNHIAEQRSVPAQIRISSGNSLLKQHRILVTTTSTCQPSPATTASSGLATQPFSQQAISPEGSYDPSLHQKFSVKVEPGSGFNLPPTPPSSSDSDDSCSVGQTATPLSPIRAVIQPRSTAKVFISSTRPAYRSIASTAASSAARDYGCLVLTDEERRTLVAEGYPVPSRLPLTKSEEKSLKKIRRKIKNKISAQESRRKKKEYMDQMERRLDRLTAEKEEFRCRVDQLETKHRQLQLHNAQLMQQLQKLQQKQLLTAEDKQVAVKSDSLSSVL